MLVVGIRNSRTAVNRSETILSIVLVGMDSVAGDVSGVVVSIILDIQADDDAADLIGRRSAALLKSEDKFQYCTLDATFLFIELTLKG